MCLFKKMYLKVSPEACQPLKPKCGNGVHTMQKKRNVCPPSSCVDVSLSAMVPVSRRVAESIAAVIDGLVKDCSPALSHRNDHYSDIT